jgi:hypothetical protein
MSQTSDKYEEISCFKYLDVLSLGDWRLPGNLLE